jgi:hypothetical protein
MLGMGILPLLRGTVNTVPIIQTASIHYHAEDQTSTVNDAVPRRWPSYGTQAGFTLGHLGDAPVVETGLVFGKTGVNMGRNGTGTVGRGAFYKVGGVGDPIRTAMGSVGFTMMLVGCTEDCAHTDAIDIYGCWDGNVRAFDRRRAFISPTVYYRTSPRIVNTLLFNGDTVAARLVSFLTFYRMKSTQEWSSWYNGTSGSGTTATVIGTGTSIRMGESNNTRYNHTHWREYAYWDTALSDTDWATLISEKTAEYLS